VLVLILREDKGMNSKITWTTVNATIVTKDASAKRERETERLG